MSAVNIENYLNVFFYVNKNDCSFWCDDYNIQGAYKGEKTLPILEMEVNTAGLYDTLNKVLF